MGFRAWGDESGSHASKDPGVYILAAAIGEVTDAVALRDAMEHLRLPSSGPKLHWVGESAERRLQIVETVATLPIEGFVVVRTGPQTDRDERRRRRCLDHLLRELTALGCAELILESRGRADDSRDRQLLEQLRRANQLLPGLRMTHTPGPADAALWIADALCGAVVQDRLGEPRYLKAIASCMTIEVIDAR